MMTDFNTHEVNVIANGLKQSIGRHSIVIKLYSRYPRTACEHEKYSQCSLVLLTLKEKTTNKLYGWHRGENQIKSKMDFKMPYLAKETCLVQKDLKCKLTIALLF
jgi:hypothetical protein